MKYYYIIINILSYLFEKNVQDLVALVKSGKRNWVTKLLSFLYFWTLKWVSKINIITILKCYL